MLTSIGFVFLSIISGQVWVMLAYWVKFSQPLWIPASYKVQEGQNVYKFTPLLICWLHPNREMEPSAIWSWSTYKHNNSINIQPTKLFSHSCYCDGCTIARHHQDAEVIHIHFLINKIYQRVQYFSKLQRWKLSSSTFWEMIQKILLESLMKIAY